MINILKRGLIFFILVVTALGFLSFLIKTSPAQAAGVLPLVGSNALHTNLYLSYGTNLIASSIPLPEDFNLTVNGAHIEISSVSILEDSVVLTFDADIGLDDNVFLVYTQGVNLIRTSRDTAISFSQVIKPGIFVGKAPVYSTLVGTKLYVSNNHSSSVTVIDTTTDSVLSTISVGDFPELSVVVGTKLYVGNLQSDSVSIINTLTDTVISTIPTVSRPYFLTVAGTKVYVSGTDTNAISVINTNTDTIEATITVGSNPWRPGLVGTKLYVPNSNSDTVSVVDTITNTVVATIAVGSLPNFALGVGKSVYISNSQSGTVSVIDTVTDTVVTTISVGGFPYFSGSWGTKVFVPTRSGNAVAVIDTITNTVITSLATGASPYDTKIINDRVYISNVLSNNVTIINPVTNTIIESIATDGDPFYITAVGKKIYSSNNSSRDLTVINTTTIPSELPNLISFTTTTPDGIYTQGQTINISANFGRSLKVGSSTMTIALNSGASVVLNTVSGSTLSGTYTIGASQSTPDLAVTSISSASITDSTNTYTRISYSLPSSQGSLVAENSFITRNLGDNTNIMIGSYQKTTVGSRPYQVTSPITVNSIPYLYIANQGNDTVSVVRQTDHTMVATITVGSEPYGVVPVSISGTTYVYVANTGSNTVSVINTATNTVVATVSVGVKPYYVSAVGSQVYVTNGQSNTVSVINANSNVVTVTIPVGVYPRGIKAHGTDLYVANYGDPNYPGGNSISVINSLTNTVTSTIVLPIGIDGPRGVTVLGSNIYVANFRSNTVSIINTATNSVTTTVNVGMGPRGMATVGTKVYIENFEDGTVSILDTNTNTITSTVQVGNAPAGIAASGTDLYITRFQDDALSILNTSTGALRSAFPVIANISPESLSPSTFRVSWNIDKSSISTLEYGTTMSYGNSVSSGQFATHHSQQLTGLTPGTSYHYRISAVDSDSNTTTTIDRIFTTITGGGGIGIINPPINIEPVGSDSSTSSDNKQSAIEAPLTGPPTQGPISRLGSNIFIAVEDKGRLWYQDPRTLLRYEISKENATELFKKVALGITNENLNKIPVASSQEPSSFLSERLKNFFLLQVENHGQIWYVDHTGYRHLVIIGNIVDFSIHFMNGILNKDLEKIKVAK